MQRYGGFGNCARLPQIIVSDGCDTLSFLRQNPHKALNPVVSGNEKRLPGGKPFCYACDERYFFAAISLNALAKVPVAKLLPSSPM